jgi:hypothetical protein
MSVAKCETIITIRMTGSHASATPLHYNTLLVIRPLSEQFLLVLAQAANA